MSGCVLLALSKLYSSMHGVEIGINTTHLSLSPNSGLCKAQMEFGLGDNVFVVVVCTSFPKHSCKPCVGLKP